MYKNKELKMKNKNANFIFQVLAVVVVTAGIVAFVMFDADQNKSSQLGDDFKYDVSELKKVDASQIVYRQVGDAVETGFKKSMCLAVDADGSIFVGGDNEVRIIRPDGSVNTIKLQQRADCKSFDKETNKYTKMIDPVPGCIALDYDDPDFFYVGVGNTFEQYNKTGGMCSRIMISYQALITSLAVHKEDVFAADAAGRVIYRYKKDDMGSVLNIIGEKDESRNIDGFVVPSPYFDIAVGGDGLLYAVNPGNHRIEAYTFDGDLEFWWGRFSNAAIDGFCGCCNPVNFAILPNDNFVTCEKGIVRVKEYDAEGKFRAVVAGPEQLYADGGIFDVAVDKNGLVYVLDTAENIVKVFAKNEQ